MSFTSYKNPDTLALGGTLCEEAIANGLYIPFEDGVNKTKMKPPKDRGYDKVDFSLSEAAG